MKKNHMILGVVPGNNFDNNPNTWRKQSIDPSHLFCLLFVHCLKI